MRTSWPWTPGNTRDPDSGEPSAIRAKLTGESAALITGGAHGIGKACAVRLAAEGARCAVADLAGSAAERVAGSLGGSPAGHLGVVIEVTQAASVDHAVAAVARILGGIDVLVNVAGGDTDHGAFEETGDQI